ncbi:MAG: SCO family protein [Chloroflexi bacterium]|nr:SCO family protein [Chloroflexota bacterium]
MRNEKFVLLGAVVGSIIIIIVIGLSLSYLPNLLTQPDPTPTPGGMVVPNVRQARDFELVDQNNKPTKLSDFRGKVVLMFFGYTHCPDVCPLEMSDYKRIKQALSDKSPDLVNHVAFLMISVDGDRDTPAVMKPYVEAFDPTFIGLTGTPAHVANIGLDYGVKVQILKSDNTQTGYEVAHTSFSYLIDPQGNWRVAYPFQTPISQIANDIAGYIKN